MTAPDSPATPPPQVRLILGAVFVMFLAQNVLNPVIAPLSREVGLAEWQVGATISAAAVMVVLTSSAWARRAATSGRRPVLLAAYALATIATASFAGLAHLGMAGVVMGSALFAGLLLLRGVAFGASLSAVPPTAQAYIADLTPTTAQRVRGIAGIGAAQGLAMVAGTAVGGAASAAGLMAPLVLVPVLLGAGLLVLALRLPTPVPANLQQHAARIRPTDPRVLPFLAAGFGMFTALGMIQVVTGFLIQDRFGLGPAQTGTATGVALTLAGCGLLFAQLVVIPRSGWGPVTLLRIGAATATAGFVLLTVDLGAVWLGVAMPVIGTGMGLAGAGYTAGASLAVEREEQPGLAGLVGATNGMTFAAAPLLGTALYGVAPWAPVALAAVVAGGVTASVLTLSRFRT